MCSPILRSEAPGALRAASPTSPQAPASGFPVLSILWFHRVSQEGDTGKAKDLLKVTMESQTDSVKISIWVLARPSATMWRWRWHAVPGLITALICRQGHCFLSHEEAGGLAGRNMRKPYKLETAKTRVTSTIHIADITVYTDLRTAQVKWKRTKQGFVSTDTLTARLSPDPPLGTSFKACLWQEEQLTHWFPFTCPTWH